MITEKDLQEAIAECEGQRDPNANTCIKLAAFYTIRQHLFGDPGTYSFAAAPAPQESVEQPGRIEYLSDTEFSQEVYGMEIDALMPVLDELMSTLEIVQPRLYAGVMRKIKDLA